MSLILPKPVTNYLAAVEAKDMDMLALCFADDALVHDEGRDYRGLDAIRTWKQETQTKYKYLMKPLDASVSQNTVKLRARLTGDFPGSSVDLDYTFTLANDKITSLEIG
jgi:ketosteroid isomerase-like protein